MPIETPRVRIFIVDGQPIFRDGLRRLLETDSRLIIVGEADSGSAAATVFREASADILLLGLMSAGPKAATPPHALSGDRSSVRTIILTDGVGRPHVTHALRLGAWGIIPKDSPPESLFNSIHSVMAGHFWVGGDRAAEVGRSLRKLEAARRRTRAFGLTRRELDIVRAVIDGCTNKEIAERTSISQNTVKSHMVHIFNKMGASTRVELALFASHHGLLDRV